MTNHIYSGERIVQRLRNNLFQSILKQDISFFDAERSGDLISRLSSDTSVMGKSLTQNLSDGKHSSPPSSSLLL